MIYRTIILPVVYRCETLSFILRGEPKLRVLENRVLRRVFRPKRDEVTGEWRKLHNEVLNDLFASPNIFRVTDSNRMRWVSTQHLRGYQRYRQVLCGKPEGKRPFARPRRDGKLILGQIIKQWHVRMWAGSIWLRIGKVGRLE